MSKSRHSKTKNQKKEGSKKATGAAKNWLDARVGDEIINGHIGHIYYAACDYIIYTTKEEPAELAWQEDDPKMKGYLNAVLPALQRLRFYLGSQEEKISYLPQIAVALKMCLEGKTDSASTSINETISQIEQAKATRNNAELRYQGISMGFMLFNILLTIVLRYTTNMDRFDTAWFCFKIAAWGSIGAWLSVSFKINRNEYQLMASPSIQALSAVSRIIIGMLSSVVIFALIQSNIALGFLKAIDLKNANQYLYYSFAVLSGFSETFVPDLLRGMERKPNQK